jgi:K+-transporting ATPase ATPase C chain
MVRQLAPAFRIVLLLTIITGVIYPLLVTGVCQLLFPRQANGSLIVVNNRVIGSELIGQEAASPRYFHSRPSAAGNGYDAMSSSASNLAPTSQKLADRVRDSIANFRAENPNYHGPIPADLVTASGSGLDPDISPASAYAQSARIANVRHLAQADVEALIAGQMQKPTLGLIGEPRVNVLKLNLALDELTRGARLNLPR